MNSSSQHSALSQNDDAKSVDDLTQASVVLPAEYGDARMEILVAAQHGDVERVQELLAAKPALVNAKGEHDKTPLHWAAEKNDRRLAKVLVAAGADINAETSWGSTPLQWAANMGSRDVSDLLLENGAAPQLNMYVGCRRAGNAGRGPVVLGIIIVIIQHPQAQRRADALT